LTPNVPEAEALTGLTIASATDQREAPARLIALGARVVVAKGGHLHGRAIDVWHDGTRFIELEAERIETPRRGQESVIDAHDHVVFRLSSGVVVTFNDPRRFGVMDLIPAGGLDQHPAIGALGPEPLSDAFDAAALARACAGKRTTLKAALLDQRVVAGLGNIYVVEALHLAGLSPQRQASTIATAGGAPRESAVRLTTAIKQVLTKAIDRQSAGNYRSDRFRVYDREALRCLRARCRGIIRRRTQGGRSSFYCPVCQR